MAQKHNLTIQVVSIIGGILTAIFFLGFLALARIIQSEISSLIIGTMLIITTLINQPRRYPAFSGCDEHHFIYSRMRIGRLWHEC